MIRYAIESGAVIEKVYRREMETPVEDMKRFMDGLLHIYDEGAHQNEDRRSAGYEQRGP